MRKLLAYLAAFGSLALTCSAQTVVASQFNNWQAYGNQNLVAGANTLVSISPCSQTGGGLNFYAIAASTPIYIHNSGSPQTDEIVTPTSVVQGGTCTMSVTVTNAHPTPWYITSGTFGLQEAINAGAQTGVLNVVQVNASWHAAGGGYANIYSAVGSANLAISDSSLAPSSTFRWNGTHYIFATGFNIGTATGAAGAAAGTSPTIATTTSSTGSLWTVTLTTGTATTTGTLFTTTFGTAFPTGGANCVIAPVGPNKPPAFTVTATSTTVETIAVTVAPPTATAYTFNGTCN